MRALMVPALAAAASGRASSTSAIAAPVPPPVVRRTRRVQTNTVLPPASLSLARREPAPLPGPSDAAVGGKEKARLPRETREIPQRSPSEKQGAQDSAKKRRPRSVGGALAAESLSVSHGRAHQCATYAQPRSPRAQRPGAGRGLPGRPRNAANRGRHCRRARIVPSHSCPRPRRRRWRRR